MMEYSAVWSNLLIDVDYPAEIFSNEAIDLLKNVGCCLFFFSADLLTFSFVGSDIYRRPCKEDHRRRNQVPPLFQTRRLGAAIPKRVAAALYSSKELTPAIGFGA